MLLNRIKRGVGFIYIQKHLIYDSFVLFIIRQEIVQEWVSALWSHYVMGNSLRDIAESNDTSVLQIRQDIKCGLAFIKSRYPRFKIDIFEKKAEKSA